jgi:hypothetical protein
LAGGLSPSDLSRYGDEFDAPIAFFVYLMP